MIKEQLEGLLNSYQFRCEGIDKEGHPVFPEGQGEPIIVKVYRNGKTRPVCRYLEVQCNPPRCNPESEGIPTVNISKKEFGCCPYVTKG